MMLSHEDLVRPSWSFQSTVDSSLDDICFQGLAMDYEIADSKLSSIFPSDASLDKLLKYPHQVEERSSPSTTENQWFGEVEDFFDWMEFEGHSASQDSTIDLGATEIFSLSFPKEDIELDDELSICHLLKAFGEAKEHQYNDLADVLSKRLGEKACPRGSVLQRLAYYMIQSTPSSLDQHYLAQESNKNYGEALSLFYQIFPYGKLAHSVANASIIEAIPKDAKMICIVDFDMGEGLQWPALFEAISKKYPKVAIRLISLKWDDYDQTSTKNWLFQHAKTYCYGLTLRVEEMGIEELAFEMKKISDFGGLENWVAFNCMRGLPHMRNPRNGRNVGEFLNLAQEYIGRISNTRGILTFARGSYIEDKEIDSQGFSSIFEAEIKRITALLDSIELQMPLQYSEARVAMECLFVAPYLSSLAKMDMNLSDGLVPRIELGARKISKNVIEEAMELTKTRDSIYFMRTEGENDNELVLSYKESPLVRVSIWRHN